MRRIVVAACVVGACGILTVACKKSENGAVGETGRREPAVERPHEWTATDRGAGPLRIGMTVADLETALGGRLAEASTSGECRFFHPTQAPAGLYLMLVAGQLARIDVNAPTVPTAAGARVGDDEARLEALYRDRLAATPHKYVVGGRYLTVGPVPPDDRHPGYRIVFETDGRRVTSYRVGRRPEVEWVERCS